jgi:hypothetical protein
MLFYPNTLLSELYKMFGSANTEKLLQVFAGTTLQIPSTARMEECMRDVIIYETITKSKGAAESRRLGEALAKQFDTDRKEIRDAYRSMLKRLGQNKKLQQSDQNVGKHSTKGKIKVGRKVRWTL